MALANGEAAKVLEQLEGGISISACARSANVSRATVEHERPAASDHLA
jgi:hypothetical protein